jgi:FkbM family methyltransferase
MIIRYGKNDIQIDVTDYCFQQLCVNNIIRIPEGDVSRASLFGDPSVGILKSIYITFDDGTIVEYDSTKKIIINTETKLITTVSSEFYKEKLNTIHKNLKIAFGNLQEEYPEQTLAVRYLTGDEKVLEIGGNIGRNSLIIASILKDNNNFVSLESSYDIACQLRYNRDINHFNFHVENAALSKRNLIQFGWNTYESDILIEGYTKVNTITFVELCEKYKIPFDTLILDCEGAFYYILLDMPEILNNIKLIIMENDYTDMNHKNYIDSVLKQNEFYVDHSLCGGWGPCSNNFYEVWQKRGI